MNVGTLITSCAICRFAVKTLMWSMGVQVEVLNMTDSSNTSMVPSVDFLNRSDFDPSAAFPCKSYEYSCSPYLSSFLADT